MLEPRRILVEMRSATIEGRLHEIDEVGAADLRAMRGRQLCRQQVGQPPEIAAGALPGLLFAQRPERIDEKNIRDLIAPVKLQPPVVADVFVDVGTGLDEYKAAT